MVSILSIMGSLNEPLFSLEYDFLGWVGVGWNQALYKPKYFLIYRTLAISSPQKQAWYLCKQTNVCVLWKDCVCSGSFSITALKPWCNGANGQPRTACVLSDYEQIHSTKLSLFSCMCQDWNGLERTAHGAAMLQSFAFTCRERHPWHGRALRSIYSWGNNKLKHHPASFGSITILIQYTGYYEHQRSTWKKTLKKLAYLQFDYWSQTHQLACTSPAALYAAPPLLVWGWRSS